MKITPSDATGQSLPQFLVVAENEAERMLLKAFVSDGCRPKGAVLHLHGYARSVDYCGVLNFNFGWLPPAATTSAKKRVRPARTSARRQAQRNRHN